MDTLLDVRAVARTLSLSPWTVRKMIAAGKLQALRIGRRVLVEPAEIDRLVSAIKKEAAILKSRD